MTEEEKKAVEAEEAKKAAEAAATAKLDEEDDLADLTLKTFEDLQKVQKERDNYREGLLKAKGKKPEDETDEERIERIVNEKIASSQFGKLVQDFQGQVKKLAEQNKELKVANRSKSAMESKGAGGGQDKNEADTDPLSTIPAELRQRLANVSQASRDKLIAKWRAANIIK